MNQKIIEKTRINIRNFWFMFNLMREKKLSETTIQMISTILEEETQKEQRYQAISNLTDILNNSQNEQEIIKKLKETYPQIVK